MSLMLLIKCLVSFGWRFLYIPLRAPRVLGQSGQSNNNKKNRRRKEEERGEGEEERRRRGRRKFLKLFQSYIKVCINIIGY